ncbi:MULTISPECIES: shikimate dehydrogenase family protein [Leuconostoc]|jgi:shikimate dehydrogenase|uniref:Shikimate dehydrogenase (NADP(+)) n=1 Tax=Leuconostoc pseudomesenteroides TaxID=33968 RepID=A0A5B8T1F8_LEUPS|nr:MULTISPECIES: shikimate dehydrogenase [Leuconostoc]MCC8439142.1 quinate dehydrogenase [Leuconostoc pseudomesenteroides]MDG9733000.1 shikimate dehydrogenase [Leuconostoc pseudomesenteroides]MDN2450686.1 shikimate dehydrogenase [Leuconostoc sp. UCMA20149]NKZ35801.1 shikimate dehydrogenase [Leuconostoc pseudomesenteroides]QEA42184.1 shikimate dehydrogenase [Leuconostoc pseudomesenteroides]
MTLYGLLAYPAGHSLSPKMQNKMINAAHIDAYYQAFDVAPQLFEQAIVGLKTLQINGFNVSTPYKNQIINYLDDISPLAQRLQAVNTVKRIKNRLVGTNTDGDGFWQSIKRQQPKENIVVIGTGGAARAIIASAREYGVRNISVFNRAHQNWSQRETEIAYLSQGIGHLEDLADNQALTQALLQTDMLVNATTVGMNDARTLLTDYQLSLMPLHSLVVDIIYRNQQTVLLKSASQRGLLTMNGIPMLVNQGALSFEYWFDQPADRLLMAKAITS